VSGSNRHYYSDEISSRRKLKKYIV